MERLNAFDGPIQLMYRQGACISLKSQHLHFVDMLSHLPPGISLRKFHATYLNSSDEQKEYFPYELLTDENVLLTYGLPEYHTFVDNLKCGGRNQLNEGWYQYKKLLVDSGLSSVDALKKLNLTEEPQTGWQIYEKLRIKWEQKGITTLKQVAVEYCLQDCVPTLKAIKQFMKPYHLEKFDIMQEFLTLPQIGLYRYTIY